MKSIRTTLVFCLTAAATIAQDGEWLAICSRCPSPMVYSKTGAGTANAVALARMSAKQFQDSCAEQGLKGAALAKCAKDEMAADGGKVYKASANCLAGTLTAVDGNQYTFAGVWPDNDIGGGRTRWRDAASGQIVGRDNASGGLGLSQQWEVLCPGPLKIAQQRSTGRAPAAATGRAGGAASPAPRATPPPPPPPVCNGEPGCTEVNAFAATMTDFRTSTAGGYRIVTASIRFRNKLARPIILGYVSGSGLATDDRGNRFQMNESTGLRGMGFVRAGEVDPKFIVGPGQTADARFEYAWYPRNNEIFGTSYDMEFTVREIVPVSATQFRVGLEHPLKWDGLGRAPVQTTSVPAAAPVPASTAAAVGETAMATAPATVPPAAVDYCQGLERCYSAGPFTAQITQVTTSTVPGGYQALGLKVKFRNLGAQPLVLAYKNGTSVAIDNHGQRLTARGANFARGIGVSAGGQVNANFVLEPGQTREASFEVQRYIGRTLIGTGFTWDVAVEQLEVLPANQVRSLREFSLNFPNLAPSGPAAATATVPSGQQINDAAKKLGDLFKRRR